MLQNEFFERTGVELSNDEFMQVHSAYMDSMLDKDAFCAQWVKQNAYKVRMHKVYVQLQENREKLSWVAREAFDKLWDHKDKTCPAFLVLTLKEMKTLENCGIRFFYQATFTKPKTVRTMIVELRNKFDF